MLYRLVRPVKRSGSSIPQFAQRIPVDVRQRAVGRTLAVPRGDGFMRVTITAKMEAVRFSLGTREPSEAKRRQAQAAGFLETVWQALRETAPVALSPRQVTALGGDLYRAWADEFGERTTAIDVQRGGEWSRAHLTAEEQATHFTAALGKLIVQTEADGLESALGPLADRLLLGKGIAAIVPECREDLLKALSKALQDAYANRARNLEGDYSPDPKADRFPAWNNPPVAGVRPPEPEPKPARVKVSLTGLVEAWWTEASAAGAAKPSTYESYRNSVAKLVKFLEHDDAARVTPEDVIKFKDHRLGSKHPKTGKPLSAKTVKDSDLAGFKTVFGWAVANHKLPRNPAYGITVKVGKRPKLRSKGFTEGEARAILRAALSYASETEQPQTLAAKRWVPWLQAYTGARVGELAQLRKEDVRQEGAYWVVRITPEAGTVKTNEAREVPLHPHLVELEFVDFVQAAPAGHLFLRPARGTGDVLGPLRGVKNRLAEFARSLVTDPNVAPTMAGGTASRRSAWRRALPEDT